MEKKSVGKCMSVDSVPLKKETEKLNHARQLLFRNDHNLAAQAAPHLGCCLPIAAPGGGYHPSGNMGDPAAMPLRFPRFIPASSSTHIPQPYLYASPSRPMFPQSDYHVGHVMSSSQAYNMSYAGGGGDSSSYTCIGAPVVGQGLLRSMDAGGKDGSLQNGLDGPGPSAINRFPDGF
ncbi:hypothetical protein SESBI_04238 [Sesbania bispinosa]|nr:hypothetical protein SESBI_04238 [Sesbania bispinosa]